jgi:hypothetical protein
MEKTTLTNLIETLEKEIKKNTLGGIKFYGLMEAQRLAKELLENEREQIMNAFDSARNIQDSDDISITYDWLDSEQYYNKTYQNK